ncbi:fibronectin type III domain-containing protein [Paenibacillaceae bacterium WGS1546]|uniref:fibronectin type III domain-containing protein n=1 Tax=Cohnella sp. WGS1546 TaxID=3366810 RepID=UPI00372D1452
MGKCKRLLAAWLAAVLLFSNGFVASEANAAEGESRSDNLLAGDFNTGFESGYSPFAVSNATSGGSLSIVEIAGNPALELRDASLGSNAGSSFTARIASGALFDRINEIYSLPVGSAPVEFVYEFKLERRAASDKPVNKDILASLQFGNYDQDLIPRFPTGESSMTGTQAYLNDEPDGHETLEKIDDEDLPGFRFSIVPNGGERKITFIEFRFSVRTDTNGTDEAYAVDDLAIYEIVPSPVSDDEAPSSPAGLTVTTQTDTTVSLEWSPSTDNVGVTGYRIYRDGVFAGAVNGNTNTYRAIGLSPNTTYSFEATARDGAGNESAASAPVAATTYPSAGNLPAPFGNADIGSVSLAGSASYDEGTGVIAVQASGADIWDRDDSFHYVYRPWTGDGEIVARVSAFAAAHSWAKAGVMVRESLNKSSKHALMAVTPTSGLAFQRRTESGGDSTNTSGLNVAAPYWVKLVREDRMISGYSSADGIEWKPVGQQELPMSGTVYFGLAVSSRNNSQLVTATFDQVNVRRIQPEQTVIRSAALTEQTGLYVLDPDAPPIPVAEVELKNRRPIAASGTVKASILARERTTVWEEEIPFEAEAFESKTISISTTALTEADYYVLQLEVSEEGAAPSGEPTRLAFGAVLPPHEGVKEDSMFGLDLRSEGNQAVMQQIAQKIGVKWRRGIKAVDPPIVNPSPGVYWGAEEIANARQEVLDWRSYGVSLLGMINYNMPWNVAPGPNGEPLSRHQNRPLDMAAHVEMVYNAISPMQDLVKYWELWNEPWVHGWTWKTGDAQDYRDMTKMIWERVKPHYPDVMLIGGGSTSYQRDIVYAKGSAHTGYIDGSTNHAYGLPDPSQLAYVKLQKTMDDLWSLGGGQGGIWQTELGTAETLHFADLPQAEQKYGVARTVAPIYLLHKLAAGDTPIRVFWFALSYGKGFSGDTLNIYDGTAPKPAVVAYSAMTHFLEDSELVEELYPQAKSAWGFLFERKDGKATAALYSDRGYSGTVTLHGAQNVKVYDYLGRLVAGGGETVTVALKPWETLYLESELAPQALKAILTNASFDFEKPLIVSPLSLTEPVQPSGTKIDVQVENASSNAISGQLRLVAPEGWTLQTNSVQVGPLQPGQKTILSFPASQTAVSDINRYLVEYSFDVYDESGNVARTQQGKQTIQAAYAPKKTIAVDGDLSDWDDVLPVTMVSNGSRDYLELLLDPSKADEILNNPGSFENVIYTVKTAWDDDYFYFQAQVPDENQSSPKPFAEDPYGFAFNSDSVQLAFDTIENNPDDLLRGDPHYDKALGSYMDYLFVGTLAQGGVPELHRHAAPGTNMQTYYPTNANFTPPIGPMDVSEAGGTEGKMKVVRDETARKTTYEIAVSWEAVPELGAQLSGLAAGQVHEGKFSFSINDSGTSGKGASQWTKEVGQVQAGAYAFAPFWGTGAIDRGGSLVPRWGFKNN